MGAEALSPHRNLARLARLTGRVMSAPERVGKVIIIPLAGSGEPDLELILHLGMTGRIVPEAGSDPRQPPHARARIRLDDRSGFWFVDPRRFGRLLVCTPGDYPELPMLAGIGPDLMRADPGRFAAAAVSSSRPLKALILDQRVVAGVGNIYADEALWRARLHPARPASQVPPEKLAELLGLLQTVCVESLASGGTTFRDYRDVAGDAGRFAERLDVYGRAGRPCRSCARPLSVGKVAGRTTVWCAACQQDVGSDTTATTASEDLRRSMQV